MSGAGRPKGACKVCQHKEAATIRRTAMTGNKTQIAKDYSISYQTIDKCIKEHRPEELRQEVDGLNDVALIVAPNITAIKQEKANVFNKLATIVDKEGWNEEVQRYADDIDDTLFNLKQQKNIHLYTNLGHVKVKLLELQGKSLGVFQPDTAIQVNNFVNSDDYKKLKQIIIQTLSSKWPDALEAFCVALKDSGL